MIAVAVGAIAAVAAYFLATNLVEPEVLRNDGVYSSVHDRNAWRFIFSTTGLGGALAFSITLAILNARAATRWRARRVPQAKQIS